MNPAVMGLPAASQGQVPQTFRGFPSGSRARLRVLTRTAEGTPSLLRTSPVTRRQMHWLEAPRPRGANDSKRSF